MTRDPITSNHGSEPERPNLPALVHRLIRAWFSSELQAPRFSTPPTTHGLP